MSGHVHWVKDIRGQMLLDPLTTPTKHRCAVMSADTFESLGDYTRSCPTGPSPGRIYRKNLGWHPSTEDNWWVFVCERATDHPGYVDHHPYKALIA